MFKLKNSEKCLNNKLFHADWHPIHHQGRVHYCHMVMTMPIEDATAEVSCPGFLVTAKMGEVLARKKGCAGGAKFAIQKKSARNTHEGSNFWSQSSCSEWRVLVMDTVWLGAETL